jgi:6-phosphogluconolactonase/glucosamine-6-phosphate isomerase/deaminase
MRMTMFNTPEELAERSAQLMVNAIAKKPDALCCFAAGFTQNQTYARFAALTKQQRVPVDRLRVIGLDEWVSLNGSDAGSCRAYIDEHIIRPVGLRQDQLLMFFDGKMDLDEQCARADKLLDEHGPIDLLVLGIGMNGHLGFNEPGTDPSARSHAPVLTDSSVRAGRKYFPQEHELRQGLTLGLCDLFQARTILVQAIGAHKAPIVRKIKAGVPDPSCPATLLHGIDAEVYVDSAAAEA